MRTEHAVVTHDRRFKLRVWMRRNQGNSAFACVNVYMYTPPPFLPYDGGSRERSARCIRMMPLFGRIGTGEELVH